MTWFAALLCFGSQLALLAAGLYLSLRGALEGWRQGRDRRNVARILEHWQHELPSTDAFERLYQEDPPPPSD